MLIPCQSPSILPAYAARASVHFGTAPLDELAGALGIDLSPHIAGTVTKRRAEYVAGRYCATQAIRTIQPRFVGQISAGADRCPAWPPGIVGSITHTRGLASAAVAPATRARGLGIDTEHFMDGEAIASVAK